MILAKEFLNKVNILIIAYFSIAFTEVFAQYFSCGPVVQLSRIAAPLLLAMIYNIKSESQNPFFYVLMVLFLVTNLLFFYSNTHNFFLAIMISIIQRMVMLLLIIRLMSEKNYGRIVLAAIPFLFIFYYLNSVTSEFAAIEFNTLFFQSILVSFIGGISLAGYLKNDNRQNSWLLISALLFIGIQFVVFIERYYYSVISLSVFNLIGILLNSCGYFTFYKFIIAAEKKETNQYV